MPVVGGDNNNGHIDCKGEKLVEHVALIPILRSGLGMVDSMLELLPNAQTHHIGMYRTKGEEPTSVLYYNRLPRNCQADVAYVMDVLIATSSTIMSVIGLLKKVSWRSNCTLSSFYSTKHEVCTQQCASFFFLTVLQCTSLFSIQPVGCPKDPRIGSDCFEERSTAAGCGASGYQYHSGYRRRHRGRRPTFSGTGELEIQLYIVFILQY